MSFSLRGVLFLYLVYNIRYINIICDLNLLNPPPPSFFFPRSLTPHLISKSARVINTSTPWISPHYLFRAVHAAAAIPTPPRPQRPLLPHHPHHRLDLAPRVSQTPTSMRPKAFPAPLRPPPHSPSLPHKKDL